ncbi:MAG: 4Fe-4S binding protein [Nitrospirae bacterium]|nr:4Fe-4S binding protein [Nitrospirota bacterium]
MLKGKIIDKALNAGDCIETDRSRCMRMRFNRNECNRCIEQCRSEAIEISHDVSISSDKCSECMLCVSSCPSDCFEIKGHDFYSVIGKLRKLQPSIDSPVLGCRSNTKKPHHARTYCFGYLSEEHIIALYLYMQNPLQIDMTGCADCKNGFIADTLQKRIAAIEAKTSLKISGRIKPVRDIAELDFQDISYDRRGFFKALKNLTFIQAAGLFDNEESIEHTQSYSAKKLPFKRELLNRAIKILPDEIQKELLKNCYYDVNVTETCNNCFACVGMCPTGALKIENKDDDRELFFSTSLCNGCGLCKDFCMACSVNIEKGFSGGNPFEFYSAKNVLLCEV